MEEKKVKVYWYIYTDHGHTNEVVGKELIGREVQTESADGTLVKCSDGVERPLWECNWSFVKRMRKNKINMGLDFKVFKKEGKNGPVTEFNFF